MTTQEALMDRVESLVRQYWTDSKRAVLLARLGQDLTKEGFDLRVALRGQSFAAAIRESLDKKVSVIQSVENPLIVGAMPTSELGDGSDHEKYLPKTNKATSSIEVPRYMPAFWAAFVTDLAEGFERFVEFQPVVRFHDEPASSNASGLKVTRAHIVLRSNCAPYEYKRKVVESIKRWLSETKTPQESVVEKAKQDASLRLEGGTILEQVINALNADQLSRTSMTLDVVKSLLRK